ncbi:MAG TPA: hypothetical protein VK592_04145 [Candidatus Dormibacteraeota bacterium]|nr:hypothetical protein [Candidatus Dormibacteraeota bacterium]
MLALLAVAAIAVGVAFAVVRPFDAGPVSYDAGSSVIHFLRITSGQHLEAFISTTPKPLLTVVFGLLHGLFDDWRALSWATIGAYGVAIALGAWLATRLAGVVAGAFVAIALIASPALMSEVGIASAVPWAMVGWAVAGLAVTAARPRWIVAGLALMLGSLARLETLVIVGVALLVLVGLWIVGRRRGATLVPAGSWWILLGFGALPVMLAHDWLLTGDPFFWLSVSARYSEAAGSAVLTPLRLARQLGLRYLPLAGFGVLGLIGALALVRARQWAVLVGLLALGPGILAFLMLLATRGTFVTLRYAVPADVALLFGAGVGAGAGWTWLSRRLDWLRRNPAAATGLGLVLLSLVALVAGWPPAPLDAATRDTAAQQLTVARNERELAPLLSRQLDTIPSSRDTVAPPGAPPDTLLVPVAIRTIMAVDLDLPLTRLGSTSPGGLDPPPGSLARTELVYHDVAADPADERYALLEVSGPTPVGGGLTLVPLLDDPPPGVWLLRVSRTVGFLAR